MSIFPYVCFHWKADVQKNQSNRPSMQPRHTTAKDGGSAENALLQGCDLVEQCRSNCRGAIFCPYILAIVVCMLLHKRHTLRPCPSLLFCIHAAAAYRTSCT